MKTVNCRDIVVFAAHDHSSGRKLNFPTSVGLFFWFFFFACLLLCVGGSSFLVCVCLCCFVFFFLKVQSISDN